MSSESEPRPPAEAGGPRPSAAGARFRSSASLRTAGAGSRLGPVLGPPSTLLVGLIAAGVSFDGFLSGPTLSSLLERSAFVGIIVVGMTYLIIAGGIDLSVGSVAALAGVVVAKLVATGMNPVTALLASVAVGAAIGAAQGIAIARGNLEPFIVTLAGLLSVRGLVLLISDERNVPLPNEGLARSIGTGTVFSVGDYRVSFPAAIMLVAFLGGAVVLRRTTFGRSLFAIGGDEKSARLLGVKVESVKVQAYAVCAGLAALAGGLLAFRQTLGRPFAAEAYELFAIGAVVVGGTLLTGGRGSMIGSLFGTLLLFLIQVSINRMGLSAFWQQLVSGTFLLIAVAAQSLLQRVSEHSAVHRLPTGNRV